MKIDRNQMKSYAGGVSGGVGVLAGATVVDYLTTITAWLVSLVDASAPPEVAGALAGLLVIVGGFLVGRFITYWFPPNEVSAVASTEAIKKQAEESEER